MKQAMLVHLAPAEGGHWRITITRDLVTTTINLRQAEFEALREAFRQLDNRGD